MINSKIIVSLLIIFTSVVVVSMGDYENSILKVASHFTHSAQIQSSTTFVCDTWVFPASGKLEPEFGSQAYPINIMKPSVVRGSGWSYPKSNFSYNQEFDEEDTLTPSVLGVRKLGTSCVSVFMETTLQLKSTEETIQEVISSKHARPHKDFFIFIGSIPLLRRAFKQSAELAELRYKYILQQNYFWNSCEQAGEWLELFSRKCVTHVAGHHFQIVASALKQFVHFVNDSSGNEKPGGAVYSILAETSRRLNFSFELKYAGFRGSSGFKRDGVWRGAVGDVFSRDADIALGIATTVFRNAAVDTSVPTNIIKRTFFIRTPPFTNRWDSIVWPLSATVWFLLLVTTLFVAIPGIYACALFNCHAEIDNPNSKLKILISVVEALYRILLEQETVELKSKNNRVRFVLMLWTFFALIIGTGYESKLITVLSFIGQDAVPRTHEELSSSNYKLYFRYMGGWAYKFAESSPLARHKRILQRALLVNSSEDCLFAALFSPDPAAWMDYDVNGEFSLGEFATLIPRVERNPLFVQSEDVDHSALNTWGFHKGSPLTESFDPFLLHILAAGLYDLGAKQEGYKVRLRGAKALRENSDKSVKEKMEAIVASLMGGPKALTTEAVRGVFLLIFGGIVGGGLALLLENYGTYGHTLRNLCKRRRM